MGNAVFYFCDTITKTGNITNFKINCRFYHDNGLKKSWVSPSSGLTNPPLKCVMREDMTISMVKGKHSILDMKTSITTLRKKA